MYISYLNYIKARVSLLSEFSWDFWRLSGCWHGNAVLGRASTEQERVPPLFVAQSSALLTRSAFPDADSVSSSVSKQKRASELRVTSPLAIVGVNCETAFNFISLGSSRLFGALYDNLTFISPCTVLR